MMLKKICPMSVAVAGLLAIAQPVTAAPVDLDTSAGEIIQVYGGCGVYGHRGPYGYCRTGGQFGGYVRGRSCPAGFHISGYGVHCLANRF